MSLSDKVRYLLESIRSGDIKPHTENCGCPVARIGCEGSAYHILQGLDFDDYREDGTL